MENKYNNTVIKVLTKEQGVEVIKWWQSLGINTRNIEGKITDYCYGIVNNRFDIVSFDFAIFCKLKIIELPKIGEENLKTEENMENLIGRNCKGFKFDHNQNRISYNDFVASKVGKIGTIKQIDRDSFNIKFEYGKSYCYPLSEIHKHLIPLEDEIPTLGEGKLMLVSNFQKNWEQREIFAKTKSGKYLAFTKELGIVKCYTNLKIWNFAKEIETEKIVELTLKDISEGKGVGVKPSLIRIKE